MTERIRAVFFDLDGTLVDHQGASDSAVVRMLARLGHGGLGRETVVGLWRDLEDEHMGRYLAGEVSFAEQRRARISGLFGHLGVGLSPREADEAFSVYLGFYEGGWRAFPDAVPALEALGGTKKGVLSNGDPGQQRAKLEAVGLSERFDVTAFSGEVGASKPRPEIFREACVRANLPPASCAYVGDRLETDARAARAAGLVGVWLNRAGRSGRGVPRTSEEGLLVVGDLTELAKHFG